jgi:hypothetical protein
MFHRLLLGSVVEALLANEVDLDLRTLALVFAEGSEFRVPRLDNYMRFKGSVEGTLRTPLSPEARTRLLNSLRAVWPDIVAVMDIPVGDKLTMDRHDIRLDVVGDRLVIRFDLSAD